MIALLRYSVKCLHQISRTKLMKNTNTGIVLDMTIDITKVEGYSNGLVQCAHWLYTCAPAQTSTHRHKQGGPLTMSVCLTCGWQGIVGKLLSALCSSSWNPSALSKSWADKGVITGERGCFHFVFCKTLTHPAPSSDGKVPNGKLPVTLFRWPSGAAPHIWCLTHLYTCSLKLGKYFSFF